MSKERIRSACDLLSAKSGQISLTTPSTPQSSTRSVPLSTKNTYSTNQIEIIDLTADDDDDDNDNVQEQVRIHIKSTTPNAEPNELSAGTGVQRLSLSYYARNHSCAELYELLETLSAKEREELARDVKVYKPGMKVRLLHPIQCPSYTHIHTEC